VPKTVARTFLIAAVMVAAAGCGYDTSATFNGDGSVTIGLKFLFPKSLMQGGSGTTISGFSPSDIAAANKKLQGQYPGSKVSLVNEGDESGALITIPFKTEKEAFGFLTQPSKLSPSASSSGSGVNLNLSNTGGMFTSATHSIAGQSDTYTFKTAPSPAPSPTPGEQQMLTQDELESIFTVTFALTVPHVITSAPGALFTLDHKTAIWKLSWTRAQTLSATTGVDSGALAANVSPLQDARLVVATGFIAVAVGFLLGMFMTWRGLIRTRMRAAQEVAPATAAPVPPPAEPPVAWPSPPSEPPPPPGPPTGSVNPKI